MCKVEFVHMESQSSRLTERERNKFGGVCITEADDNVGEGNNDDVDGNYDNRTTMIMMRLMTIMVLIIERE